MPHRQTDRWSKVGEKIVEGFSALWQKVRQDRHDSAVESQNKDDTELDAREEAGRLLVVHSRLQWSASNTSSSAEARSKQRPTARPASPSTLESDFTWLQERDQVFNAFRVNDGSSCMGSLSTLAQSPSPPEGHPLALQRETQSRRYAHHAWTPPEGCEVLSEDEECERSKNFVRELLERCKEKVSDGKFDESVIGRYFRQSYCHRTTPSEQHLASIELRNIVEANQERKRLQFEEFQRQNYPKISPSESLVKPRLSEYQIDFDPNVSSFGDIVDDVLRRSGGSWFL